MAVIIDPTYYYNTNGSKPKGNSSWAFYDADPIYGKQKPKVVFTFNGSFADARKAAQAWAKENGFKGDRLWVAA